MRKYKALIAVLTVAVLVFGLVGTAFAASAPSDVQGTKYEAAASKLMAYGVSSGWGDGKFNPSAEVTRAQFSVFVVNELGLKAAAQAAQGTDTKFKDVKGSYWASGAIQVATDKGIISGYGDGTFKPDNAITYTEAAILTVRALGYREADPNAHVLRAGQLGLLVGVDGKANDKAIRGELAIILANMLNKEIGEVKDGNWQSTGATPAGQLQVKPVSGTVLGYDVTAKTVTIDSTTYALADNFYLLGAADPGAAIGAQVEGSLQGAAGAEKVVYLKVTVPAPDKLQVVGVTALNANQIAITFSKPVTNAGNTLYDSTTGVINGTNITVTPVGSASTIAGSLKGELSKDKKTLTVSLAAAGDKFSGTYGVYVKKDSIVALSDSTQKIAEFTGTVLVNDQTKPFVGEVTYQVTEASVKFSEPLKTVGTVSLDGVQLTSGTDYDFTAPSNKLVVKNLKPGTTYALAISGAQDAAGNFISPNPATLSLAVPSDTTAPTVNISVENTKVIFKFSEELKLQDLDNNGSVAEFAKASITPVGGVATVVYLSTTQQDATDKTLFTYDAVGLLGGNNFGTFDIKVEGFKDKAENAGSSVTKSGVVLTKDTTKPQFQSASVVDDKLVLKFDEDVNVFGSPASLAVTYVSPDGVVDTTNTTLTISATANEYDANGDGTIQTEEKNYVVFTVSSGSPFISSGKLKAGKYEVTVPAANLVDQAGNNPASDVKLSLTVSSTSTAATVELLSATQVSNGVIKATFNSNMGSSALQYINYTLDGVTIPSDSKIYFYGDKENVQIELPEGYVTVSGNREFKVSNLTDVDGNTLKSTATTAVVSLTENVRPTALKVELIDPQSIRVTFSEKLGTAPTTGFKVKVNGVEIALHGTTPFTLGTGDDANKVIIKAESAAAFKTTDAISVEILNTDAADLNGNKVKDGTVNK